MKEGKKGKSAERSEMVWIERERKGVKEIEEK